MSSSVSSSASSLSKVSSIASDIISICKIFNKILGIPSIKNYLTKQSHRENFSLPNDSNPFNILMPRDILHIVTMIRPKNIGIIIKLLEEVLEHQLHKEEVIGKKQSYRHVHFCWLHLELFDHFSLFCWSHLL